MRRPVQLGERYIDCTGRVAVAQEVWPVIHREYQRLLYFVSGHAPDWMVSGLYESYERADPGEVSLASWRDCCVRMKERE